MENLNKGEVVVIDENFGVRITEIINSIDRLRVYSNRRMSLMEEY